MRKLTLSLLTSAVLAHSLAGAAPVNPLVRPAALAGSSASQGSLGNLPPPPMPGAYNNYGAQGGAYAQGADAVRQDALPNYTVVVIAGDAAVLRVLPAAVSTASSSPMPGQPGYGMPATSAAPSAPTVLASSLMVKHKQRLRLGDQELLAEVAHGVVTLTATATARVVFSGRVDGSSYRQPRAITLEAMDMGYVARQTARSPATAGGVAAAAGTGTAAAGAFGAR